MNRILFVPVSGARGMGEYVRCITLAESLVAAAPTVQPHFLLSSEAPYASSCPFDYTLLPSSPTLSGKHTEAAMTAVRPDVVVFDNAGRSAHIHLASRKGAAVVYISSRARQRRKAFRFRWMSWLTEHWIAQPECSHTQLTYTERARLGLHGSPPRVRYVDAVLPERVANALDSASAYPSSRHRVQVLIVPGGGTAHPGSVDAPTVYVQAAEQIAAAGYSVVHVGAASIGHTLNRGALRGLGHVSPAMVRVLMEASDIVVTNGGDTLLQALALGKPCVAAPIARDQPARLSMLNSCVLRVPLTPTALASATCSLVNDRSARQALEYEVTRVGVRDRRDAACSALLALMK